MRKGNGFTLIELLVVIITIEFLLAELMPAKQKFKKLVSEKACRSNLKSVELAMPIILIVSVIKLQDKKSFFISCEDANKRKESVMGNHTTSVTSDEQPYYNENEISPHTFEETS